MNDGADVPGEMPSLSPKPAETTVNDGANVSQGPPSPSPMPAESTLGEGANSPVATVLVARKPAERRSALLLAIGGVVGLGLGIMLTIGTYATYTFFFETLPSTRDSVLVFNELNELRQQVNELNEQRKLKDQEAVESVRKSLGAVASAAAPAQMSAPPEVSPAIKTQRRRPPGVDPFADLDAEIEDLQRNQKVLNTILDLFTPKRKEAAKAK